MINFERFLELKSLPTMKTQLQLLSVVLILSCSTTKQNLNDLNLTYNLLNEAYKNKSDYKIYFKSAKPYSKEFILKDLVNYNVSFYNESTYDNYESKKDSLINLKKLSSNEKDTYLKKMESELFFDTKDFFSPKDITEFADSIDDKIIKWNKELLAQNIVLSKDKNQCAISIPIFNSKRDKAIIFKKCSSSENFDAFELTSAGKWRFVFTANILLYD